MLIVNDENQYNNIMIILILENIFVIYREIVVYMLEDAPLLKGK